MDREGEVTAAGVRNYSSHDSMESVFHIITTIRLSLSTCLHEGDRLLLRETL